MHPVHYIEQQNALDGTERQAISFEEFHKLGHQNIQESESGMKFGLQISGGVRSQSAVGQLDDILRLVEVGQRYGFSYFFLGQNFLYDWGRWLQPIPVFARLAAELDGDTRLAIYVLPLPLYHPISLAEDLATLDIIAKGRLTVGVGPGYRAELFDAFNIPYTERYARHNECLSLLKLLWQDQEVNYQGRFWQLKGVTPHIFPLQQPRPPIWVGTWGPKGAALAARLADAMGIPPKIPVSDIVPLLRIFSDERERNGLPPALHPIRRDLFIGRDRYDALERLARQSEVRYAVERFQQQDIHTPQVPEIELENITKFMGNYAIVGTADECIAQLRALGETLPVEPIVFKPQWEGMDVTDAVDFIVEVGTTIVPALHDVKARALSL